MSDETKPDEYLPLVVFGQLMWHCEASIVGTEAALKVLRDAIDEAIVNNASKRTFMPGDGEGYYVEIIKATEDEVNRLPNQYTDENANSGDDLPNRFEFWKVSQRTFQPTPAPGGEKV